jgi:hypothetical protein
MRSLKHRISQSLFVGMLALFASAACSSDAQVLSDPMLVSPQEPETKTAPSLTPTASPQPTKTAFPTPSQTPTRLPPQGTPTPLVIGTSVAGNPLQVFTFGDGPSKRMIVIAQKS